MGKVFLLKTNENDRDCVKYLEIEGFECGHYFGGLRIHGACFCGFEKELEEMVRNNFENLETILTKDEFVKLFDLNKELKNLGYGITENDERYQKGIKILAEMRKITDKLNSEENKKLFEKVQKEEKEFLYEEYGLDDEDIEYIFDNYYLEYRDRAVICCVWNNIYDCAYDEVESFGYVDHSDYADRYFDYDKFGSDLLYEDRYVELKDGRVVLLSY